MNSEAVIALIGVGFSILIPLILVAFRLGRLDHAVSSLLGEGSRSREQLNNLEGKIQKVEVELSAVRERLDMEAAT